MDANELSLSEIHKSIGITIKSLKVQLTKVENLIGESSKLNKLAEDILEPACRDVGLSTLTGTNSLLKLLSRHQEYIQSAISPQKIIAKEDPLLLPIVRTTAQTEKLKPRPPSASNIRYPALSPRLTQSLKVSRNLSSLSTVRTPPSGSSKTNEASNLLLIERQTALSRFCDQFETCNIKMQEIFTTLTQKILVPLQAFCKPTCRDVSATANESKPGVDSAKTEKQFSKDLHRNEFILMETLSKCRQLLWQNDNPPEAQFSSNNHINEVFESKESNCHSITQIHTDVLKNFGLILKCASLWLKRDEIYTENAKSGFSRAHRRFVKTQRMWQEARQNQRDLTEEWKHKNREIRSQEMRLETLENDMEALKENLAKLLDERQTVEIQLLNTTSGMERLRWKHRELRKHINSCSKKIEGRERNCALVQCRLRGIKADRDAVREKLQINFEFVESLQEKMIKIFNDREAWKRRHDEKTSPEILQNKLEAVGLRVPSFILREKTFVLKSRSENLRDAIAIVTARLDATGTHWSLLCHYLNWPKQFLLTLRSSNARIRRRAFSERDSSSSSSSASSQNGKTLSEDVVLQHPAFTPSVSTQRIVNYVKTNCPGSNHERCSFMLKLWLDKNDQLATLEQLVRALQEVRDVESSLSSLKRESDT